MTEAIKSEEVVGIVPGEYVQSVMSGKKNKLKEFFDSLIERRLQQQKEEERLAVEQQKEQERRERLKKEEIAKRKEAIRVNDVKKRVDNVRDDLIFAAFGIEAEYIARGKDLLAKKEEEESKIEDQLLHDQHQLGATLLDKDKRAAGKMKAIDRERKIRGGLGAAKAIATTGISVGTTLGGIALGLANVPAALLGGASALVVGLVSVFWQSKISKKREVGNVSDAKLDQKEYEGDLKNFIAKVEKIEEKIKAKMPDFLEKQKVMKEDVFKDYVKSELIELFEGLGISVGEAVKESESQVQKQLPAKSPKNDEAARLKKEEQLAQQVEEEESKRGMGE